VRDRPYAPTISQVTTAAAQSSQALAPDGPPLTVAGAARRIGIAPATLRTWDRRYGLGPSARSEGGHRRYTHEDLARLAWMQRLLVSGVPVAEAAAQVADRQRAIAPPGGFFAAAGEAPSGVLAPAGEAPSGVLAPAGEAPGGVLAPAGEAPGGVLAPALRLPTAPDPARTSRAVRGLMRAASAQDGPGARALLDECLDALGVSWTWQHVLGPVLVELGRRWEATGQGIEVEHQLTDISHAALRRITDRLSDPVNDCPVVLAGAPDDLHGLPLHVTAAALAERGIASLVLGARVTVPALCACVARVGPPAVLIWAQLARALPAGLDALRAGRTPPLILLAGPGWPAAGLPDWPRPATLDEALGLLRGSITG